MKRPAFYDDWKSLHAFRVIEKVFKFLYNMVEPEKQVFCMSFVAGTFRANVPSGEERGETDVFAGYAAHRPNFLNFFRYKSEEAKNTSRVSKKTTCT